MEVHAPNVRPPSGGERRRGLGAAEMKSFDGGGSERYYWCWQEFEEQGWIEKPAKAEAEAFEHRAGILQMVGQLASEG